MNHANGRRMLYGAASSSSRCEILPAHQQRLRQEVVAYFHGTSICSQPNNNQKQIKGEENEDVSYLNLPIDEQMDYLIKEQAAEHKQNPRPWINLLTYPGKARWRVTSKYPDQLVQERSAMLQKTHRTGRQLKRAFRHILDQHQKLAEMRERDRILETTGKQVRRQKKKSTKEAVQKAISYGPEQTFVSINNRLLPNFAVTRRVLKEVTALLGGAANFKPKRVIDFGCGCGSASAAAMSVFQNKDDKTCELNWIHGIEPSLSQREAAERVLTAMKKTDEEIAKDVANSDGYLEGSGDSTPSYGEGSRMMVSSRLPRVTMSDSIAIETSSDGTDGSFDLALFCYTAQELPHTSSSLAAAAIMWEKLAIDGVFVMIEPGTPDGFNSVRAVREMLLDCCPPNSSIDNDSAGIECHVIAPCTHNGRCPMDPMSRHRETLIVDEDQDIGGVKKVDDAEMEVRKRLNLDDEDFLLSESATDEWLELDDDEDDDNDGDDDSDNDPYASWGEGEKAWFEREFETLIGEGKIFEDHSWQPKALGSTTIDVKSKRKGAHTEDVHVFGDAFCGFTHMLPVGNRKGEKFSYLVMQKRRGGAGVNNDNSIKGLSPLSKTNIVHLLSESLKSNGKSDFVKRAEKHEVDFLASEGDPLGLEFLQGSNRNSWGRLMRAPIKRKGHIIVDFCSSGEKDGKIVRHRVSKAKSERVAPGMYTAARKARWGGLWPDLSKPTNS